MDFNAGRSRGRFGSIEEHVSYDREAYTPPVLAGFGAGATLAYGALAQAPSGSFAGAISLGFCPEIEASHPLCAGRGGPFDRRD